MAAINVDVCGRLIGARRTSVRRSRITDYREIVMDRRVSIGLLHREDSLVARSFLCCFETIGTDVSNLWGGFDNIEVIGV